MQDDPFADRLKRLEERIEASRSPKDRQRGGSKMEASALGWRMVTELLAGILLGLAIGYGLDSLFGTLPVFLVVFALLGFAAGVRTMMRSVDEVRRKPVAADAPRDEIAARAAREAGGKSGRDGNGGPTGHPRD